MELKTLSNTDISIRGTSTTPITPTMASVQYATRSEPVSSSLETEIKNTIRFSDEISPERKRSSESLSENESKSPSETNYNHALTTEQISESLIKDLLSDHRSQVNPLTDSFNSNVMSNSSVGTCKDLMSNSGQFNLASASSHLPVSKDQMSNSSVWTCKDLMSNSGQFNLTSASSHLPVSKDQMSNSSVGTCKDLMSNSGQFNLASASSHLTVSKDQMSNSSVGTCKDLMSNSGQFNLASASSHLPVSKDQMSNSSVGTCKDLMSNSGQFNLTSASSHLTVSKDQISVSGGCRFPKLEECAHFHYERVELGGIKMCLVDDQMEHNKSDIDGPWFTIHIESGHNPDSFLVRRSLDNLVLLDNMLHRCVYDRKVSGLVDLSALKDLPYASSIEDTITEYLSSLNAIADDTITCGPVLTWLRLDNKGRKLLVPHDNLGGAINTPAVGAAYGVRRYVAQARDEISFEVGDMISVIDMPSPAESAWWRGKRGYEVGFFPQACVATIGDKVPRHLPMPAPLVGSLALSPSKPVLRKHGKLIAFFRSFILSRPSRRRLKQSGILKERVFSCDLGEHLLNSGQDIPMVLKCCAEFIEKYGIVDGIYRLSGITSNIQKLRRAFDEEREPDLTHPDILQDIHCVSSLLKMYFRELPNPLCTYQLYHSFVSAVQHREKGDEGRLKLMREAVLKLPPPHYRTLRFLTRHLARVALHGPRTGMTSRNIAIVWAPNLLRCARLENGGVAALQGVGVQAVVTEFLIGYSEVLFSDTMDVPSTLITEGSPSSLPPLPSRPKSLAISTPTKLLSLEEARSRHLVGVNMAPPSGYIEVGGGPSSLPDKYHTVLPLPRGWHKRNAKRSPLGWRSFFSRSRNGSASNLKGPRNNPRDTTDSPTSEIPMNHSRGSIESLSEQTTGAPLLPQGAPLSRTAGHSRSVSHDSYFDCLQSPTRSAPMEELSELRLNFDLEEPEMRIFSDDESLVSSPKVAKENARRVLSRARPEECYSAANSGNPSPKKQARLVVSPNGSLRKRYKLEDQLSDIQFIDCSTPEHGNTVYTSVQVHQPPKTPIGDKKLLPNTKTTNKCIQMETSDGGDDNGRENLNIQRKEFLSYNVGSRNKPFSDFNVGSGVKKSNKFDRYSCFEPKTTQFDNRMAKCASLSSDIADKSKMYTTIGDRLNSKTSTNSVLSEKLEGLNSVTSPMPQTPNYHPLVAETDSENSSATTPVSNFSPNLMSSNLECVGCDSSCTKHSKSCENNSNFKNSSGETTPSAIENLNLSLECKIPLFDIEKTKKKMSLDLNSDSSPQTPQNKSPNILSTPDFDKSSDATTPNYTLDQSITSETTSQSLSPADISYQVLNRLSHVSNDTPVTEQKHIQTIEIKENSGLYENVPSLSAFYENVKPTFINLSPVKCKSPIKSTISITYNLKSPIKISAKFADAKSPKSDHKQSIESQHNDLYETFKMSSGSTDNQIMNDGNVYENVNLGNVLSCEDAGVPTDKANLPIQQACQPEKCLELQRNEVYEEFEFSKPKCFVSVDVESGNTTELKPAKKPLLETNLDEVLNDETVYQTVKIYKNAISEVNDLLDSSDNLHSVHPSIVNIETTTITEQDNHVSENVDFKLSIIVPAAPLGDFETQTNSDVSAKSLDSIENPHVDFNETDSLTNADQLESETNSRKTDLIKQSYESLDNEVTIEHMSDNQIVEDLNLKMEHCHTNEFNFRNEELDSLECNQSSEENKMEDEDAKMEEVNDYENVFLGEKSENSNIDILSLARGGQSSPENKINHEIIEPMEVETYVDHRVLLDNQSDQKLNSDVPICSKCVIDPNVEHSQLLKQKTSRNTNQKQFVSPTSDLKLNYDIKAGNFIVKQLATKFELSPVDSPVFSFSQSGRTEPHIHNIRKEPVKPDPTPCVGTKNLKLNKNKITRSLDEHAFTREFTCTSNPIVDDDIMSENEFPTRRKSLDSYRTKFLNPPKKLPNIEFEKNKTCKINNKCSFSLEIKSKETLIETDESTADSDFNITPTSENKISLIQHNIHQKSLEHLSALPTDSLKSTLPSYDATLSSLEDISASCKLNRERMEKYKQERRTFLRDKYRSESFRNEKDQALSRIKQKTTKSEPRDIGSSETRDSLGNLTSLIGNNENRNMDPCRGSKSNYVKNIAENVELRHPERLNYNVSSTIPTYKKENRTDITGGEQKYKNILDIRHNIADAFTKTNNLNKKSATIKEFDRGNLADVKMDGERYSTDFRNNLRELNKDVCLGPTDSGSKSVQRTDMLCGKHNYLDNLATDRRSFDNSLRKSTPRLDRRSLNERERQSHIEERDRKMPREKCSPSVSIKDVTAMFESKSN